MKITDFTVEEINLISIYEVESRRHTMFRIHDVYNLMDENMQIIATSAVRKLTEMTDEEFALADFIPAE